MTHDPASTPAAVGDPERLAALRRTALLDTGSEEAFDRLTRLAARMLDAPIALVTLVDADRQFFKSQTGLPEPWATRRETPLRYSLCQNVTEAEPLAIDDARADPRFQAHHAFTEMGLVAYAGVPLVTDEGHALGAFCVADTRPRAWTPEQMAILRDLAASVMTEIELRRAAREADAARDRQRAFMDIAPVGVMTFSPRGALTYENREAQRIFDTAQGHRPFRLLDVDGSPLPPERVGLVRALRGEVGEDGFLREDVIVERADGSRVWIQAHVSRVSDAENNLLGVLIVCTDITERQAALQALQLRHRAVEEDPNGVIIADARRPDCPVLYVNPAFQRITGYAASEVLGRNCRFLQGDERDQAARETLRRAVAAGEGCRVVLRNFRKDGTPFWNDLSLAPLYDASGNLTHFIGILIDVTAGKEAENALRTSEERYRAFVQNSSEAIWRFEIEPPVPVDLDEEAQIVAFHERAYLAECNDAMAQMHGFEQANDIVGARFDAVLEGSDREHIAHLLRAFIRSGYCLTDAESEERSRSNERRRFLNNLVGFVTEGALGRVWGTQRDVTDQKRAEEALKESEERFRLLVEGARDYALFMLDTAGRIISWSAGAERVLGWAEAEVLGRDGALIFTPEDREAGVPEGEKRTAIAEGRAEDKRWHLKKDGTRFFADGVMTSLHAPDGSLRGFAKVMRDATESRRIEEQKARFLEEAQARARREELANRIGQALRAAPDPAFVQQVAVEELGRALGADRCYFAVYSRGRGTVRIEGEWRRSEELPALSGEYRLAGVSINMEALLRAGESVIAPDVETHATFAHAADQLKAGRVRSLINVPFIEGKTVASLTVAMADRPRAWTPDEIALAEMVAAQTRSTMEAARLLQRELTISEHLQNALTPALPGNVPGLALASFYRSALAESRVGGDFFDVFPLDKGCIALIVGDLSGKGLQAASQVATVRNMLRFALYQSESLAQSLRSLNDTISEHDLLTGFVSLFAGVYNSGDGTFTYVSCGHEPGLLYRGATGAVEELPPTGPVIGAAAGRNYRALSMPFAPEDVLLLYTDGLSEAGRNRHDFLETRGLARILAEAAEDTDAERIKDRIVAAVEAHAGGLPHDDMCALIARVKGKA